MHRYFACLMVTVFTLLAAPRADLTAAPSGHQVAPVDILVDGGPQRRYAHDGRWYVEALKGREYAIRLHNPYGVRVAVALSVDGLNTIDARQTAAAHGRKWVVGPYQTVTISGWQTSRTEARRFEFTTEARSYGQALGKTDNLGVISAVFFRERASTIVAEAAPSQSGRRQAAAPPSASAEDSAVGDAAPRMRAVEEYAATGMGRRTGHAVEQVWLELEDTPAITVNIRYEFRPQLRRLGILPATVDPLQRRERACGFEPGFSPEVPFPR